jgi:Flp pilus assembly protein CpaB
MVEGEKHTLLPGNTVVIIVLAVVLGFIGVALMNYYTHSKIKKVVMDSVAEATQTITGGTTIAHGMLKAVDVPKGTIGGNFVKGGDIISVEGRVVGVDMDVDQPLYWNAIPMAAQGGYDKYLRPENRERAFAIGLGGALVSAVRPGDVIDILGTYSQGGPPEAFEVLPAVTVIDKVGSVLVLDVTPEEELLLLAAQSCNPTLSIRNKEEPKEDMKLEPVKLTDVLPKAKELGAERTERLRTEAPVPAPNPTGSIHRD